MNVEQAIDILHTLVLTSLSVILPLLITAMTIGVCVSLLPVSYTHLAFLT